MVVTIRNTYVCSDWKYEWPAKLTKGRHLGDGACGLSVGVGEEHVDLTGHSCISKCRKKLPRPYEALSMAV